jgi:DNA-damage-inducible protein J
MVLEIHRHHSRVAVGGGAIQPASGHIRVLCATPGTHDQRNGRDRRLLTRGAQLGHNGYMSAIAKSRIDPELKRQAEAVLEEIGLKPRAALELFYKQIIKRRAIPFPVQADSPEDEVLSPAARRNKLADEF